jgi:hypothetical protein
MEGIGLRPPNRGGGLVVVAWVAHSFGPHGDRSEYSPCNNIALDPREPILQDAKPGGTGGRAVPRFMDIEGDRLVGEPGHGHLRS